MKIIGVAGGSGSGKTTIARMIAEEVGSTQSIIIAQDHYYIDQSLHFDRDGGKVNFDHPHSIDWALMVSHLKALKHGQPVKMPQYDFSTHQRRTETYPLSPAPFCLVDGILIFNSRELVELIDYKIFIDAHEDVRFSRRLKRDVEERGRTPEGVRAQFLNQVKPMHDLFVEPTRHSADLVLSGEEPFGPKLNEIILSLMKR